MDNRTAAEIRADALLEEIDATLAEWDEALDSIAPREDDDDAETVEEFGGSIYAPDRPRLTRSREGYMEF